MLRRTAILFLKPIGVMARHVDGRPTEAGLLLCLGDNRIEGRRLKVTEGMKVNVSGEASRSSDTPEGMAHRIGVWRIHAGYVRREDEVCWYHFNVSNRG